MRHTGAYGQEWTHGVLVDHVEDSDTVVFVKGEAFVKDGVERVPVLCGEFVEVWTEDGPMDGRCGRPVPKVGHEAGHACEGHAMMRAGWMNMDELERLDVEREEDLLYG